MFKSVRRLACFAAVVVPVASKGQCRVPVNSNEARLLAFYATPLTFSAITLPRPLAAGAVSLVGELGYVPSPDPALTSTSQCYPAKKESTELSPVFPRPRLIIGLGSGLSVEASYLPPVTIADASANLVGAAVAFVHDLTRSSTGSPVRVMVRAHLTRGKIQGPITCDKSALQLTTSSAACYGTKVSKDTYRPNVTGGEAVLAYERWDGRYGVYLGGGVSRLEPRFQVHFENQDPQQGIDSTRVEPVSPMNRFPVFGGASLRITSRVDLGAQIYTVPKDATTARIAISYRMR